MQTVVSSKNILKLMKFLIFSSENVASVKNQIQPRNVPRAIPDAKESCFAIRIVILILIENKKKKRKTKRNSPQKNWKQLKMFLCLERCLLLPRLKKPKRKKLKKLPVRPRISWAKI